MDGHRAYEKRHWTRKDFSSELSLVRMDISRTAGRPPSMNRTPSPLQATAQGGRK